MLDADCQDSHCLFFWLESRVKHASRKCVLHSGIGFLAMPLRLLSLLLDQSQALS